MASWVTARHRYLIQNIVRPVRHVMRKNAKLGADWQMNADTRTSPNRRRGLPALPVDGPLWADPDRLTQVLRHLLRQRRWDRNSLAIIEAHRAGIRAESVPGHGATFGSICGLAPGVAAQRSPQR